ncbi:MAG: MBG domain-containing protein, partial [Isosphaeraceae bacterium]
GQPSASSDNFVALTSTLVAHELGHLLGLRHSDSFGPIGINPATGLPYGLFPGLISKSAVRNETRLGVNDPGTGATTTRYSFSKSPVLLGPVNQAGNATPTPHPSPSGTVYDGVSPVASFVVTAAAGAVVVTPIGTPERTVLGGQLDTETGVLTLSWSARPVVSSIVVTYDYDAFRPGYRGPDDAGETPNHIMGSPASVGSRISDALGDPYFGERELTKLAFADAGTTVREADLGLIALTGSPLGGQARSLGTLPGLAVPNLLRPGAVHAGRPLNVRAISVVGSIAIDPATGRSQNDVYSFQGQAGDLVTLEVLSYSIRQRLSGLIDSVVSLHDASGNVLDYYGRPAINDDGFDNQDAILIDVLLPATGTYHVVVDTYASSLATDVDTGEYELAITSYVDPAGNPARLPGGGDTLVAGLGGDVLIGATGDDRLVGKVGDLYLNFSATDVVGPNTAPVAVEDSYAGFQDQPIVVSQVGLGLLGNDRDDERDPLVVSLVTGSGPLRGSLTLNPDGTFSYTPNPGYFGQDAFSYRAFDGASFSAPVVVTIQLAQVQTSPIAEEDSYQTLEDTPLIVAAPGVLANDPRPGQSVVLQSTTTHGQLQLNLDGSFIYHPFLDFFGIDSFTYVAVSGSHTSLPATVTIDVTAVNDDPLVSSVTNDGPATYGNLATVTVVASDVDGPTLSYEFDFDDDGIYEVGPRSMPSASFAFPAVGTYLVGVRVTDGAGGAATRTTTIQVTPRPVTIAADSQTKTYGDDDPTLTYRITSGDLVNGDTLTGTLSRAPGENVSAYPIVRNTLTAGANYTITFEPAALTITPRSAVVTPNAASKVYGASDPVLTGALSGFLSGDGVSATYARAAGETVLGGPYAITATLSPTSVLTNYVITYQTAALTITPRSAVVTPNAASKVYGASDPVLTGALSGFLSGDGVSATYARAAGEDVGVYPITATLSPVGVLTNYAVTYQSASFTITPAAYTIALAASTSVSVPGQYVTFTATVGGSATGSVTFRNGSVVLGTRPLSSGLASLAVSTLEVGNHTITATFVPPSNPSGSVSAGVVQSVQRVAFVPGPQAGQWVLHVGGTIGDDNMDIHVKRSGDDFDQAKVQIKTKGVSGTFNTGW